MQSRCDDLVTGYFPQLALTHLPAIMFFSITPTPIFRGPPVQARSADPQVPAVVSKPVEIMKRRMSRCLTHASIDGIRSTSETRTSASCALARQNHIREDKINSILKDDPAYASHVPISMSTLLIPYTDGY